ncbi:MAG TPA: DUF1801 domain-containing protein [Anaerolineales bacterium]|nr:DUF1801 domain-containing protein [Anaerolineales bacterium]
MKQDKLRMITSPDTPKTIDEYIAIFPADVQVLLQKVRATIKKAAPKAEEMIRYKMPTFALNGKYLIYFAGYQKHISLYPAPIGNPEFAEEIAPYESGKGTLKFPLDKPIPFKLITRIVRFRAKENLAKAKAKRRA